MVLPERQAADTGDEIMCWLAKVPETSTVFASTGSGLEVGFPASVSSGLGSSAIGSISVAIEASTELAHGVPVGLSAVENAGMG